MEREPDIDVASEYPPAARVGTVEAAAIFAGGFLGAAARAALSQLLPATGAGWPWATFAVNVAASAVLGFAIARLGSHPHRRMYARAFVATGVCGGLSTFSTAVADVVRLAEHAGWGTAAGYAAASVAAGLAAVVAGTRLARSGR